MIITCYQCTSDMEEVRTDVFKCPFCGYQVRQLSLSPEITQADIEAAAANDIGKGHVVERVKRYNWPIEEAITETVRKHEKHGNWPEIAEKNDIAKHTYYARVKSGWSHERAATDKVDKKKTPYSKRGVTQC
ncbi:hypothetical protein [Paenibacillus xylanilyticus]|uniref:Uncharacterized protein n=1 Tax=Paenibacillus xylanilyticus TaxID=248903 RepID=A0A7Y6BXV7_9BACL|nr:hypothetical protein [Paenibacillus xylanilyticus]NUU76937.1 hypothetical protein [Paenibacillus xylanilyticus]